MRSLMTIAAVASLLLASTASAESKPNFKPGQWETTMTMEMPGMPMALPPVVTSSCLTEKDMVPSSSQPGQECKITKQKATGNNVEWAIECKDKNGNVSTMSGKGSYKDDTFTGTMQMSMAQGGGQAMQMSAKMTSKRLGPCKPATP